MAVNYRQPLDVQRFVRFYDGQYMTAQDFVDDQHHRIARERRLNRLLLGEGIIEGFEAAIDGTHIVIQPGTAVDSLGRILEVSESVTLGLPEDALDSEPPNAYLVYLAYRRVAADPREHAGETPEGAVQGETRWLEEVDVYIQRSSTNGSRDEEMSDEIDVTAPVAIIQLVAPDGALELHPFASGVALGDKRGQTQIRWNDGGLSVGGHLSAQSVWAPSIRSSELQTQSLTTDGLAANSLTTDGLNTDSLTVHSQTTTNDLTVTGSAEFKGNAQFDSLTIDELKIDTTEMSGKFSEWPTGLTGVRAPALHAQTIVRSEFGFLLEPDIPLPTSWLIHTTPDPQDRRTTKLLFSYNGKVVAELNHRGIFSTSNS